MRKFSVLTGVAVVVTVSALSTVAAMAATSPDRNAKFSPDRGVLTLAVYGDAPYGTTPTDNAEFLAMPVFINSINADPQVSLVAHVGDIHAGKQYCTQSYDESIA